MTSLFTDKIPKYRSKLRNEMKYMQNCLQGVQDKECGKTSTSTLIFAIDPK